MTNFQLKIKAKFQNKILEKDFDFKSKTTEFVVEFSTKEWTLNEKDEFKKKIMEFVTKMLINKFSTKLWKN